ncbi:MAG: alpha-2-macroglobulin family protein [Candidatus Aminicenantales bacterium]
MAKLFDQRESLSLFGRTLLLKAMYQAKTFPEARNTLIKELLNKIRVKDGEAYLEDDEGRDGFWLFSSNGRTTASGLQTLVEVGYDHPSLAAMARWLVNRQKALLHGNFGSTQENLYLFYGLNAFYSSREAGSADFTASFLLLTQHLRAEKFSPATKEIKKTRFRLDELLKNKEIGLRPGIELPLRIEQQGRGSLYYGVRITYAPRDAFSPRDNGLAVIKSIEPLNKNLARGRNEIKAGSLAVVTLEIAVPQESMYVVVNDPLPAGFEAINPAFQTESEEAQRQLAAQFETELQRRRVWWSGFDYVERHDDRVLFFANWLPPGVYVHRYLVGALNRGIYGVPGTKVEQMYSPEVFGRAPEITVKIGR